MSTRLMNVVVESVGNGMVNVYADTGMRSAIKSVEGVMMVVGGERGGRGTLYTVYLDPRYDQAIVKADIIAAMNGATDKWAGADLQGNEQMYLDALARIAELERTIKAACDALDEMERRL